MRYLLLTLGLLLAAQPSFALQETMKNYRGARSLSMGGVLYTTGLYDESLFGNPALQLDDPAWKISLLNITAELNDHMISDYSDVMKVTSAQGNGVLTTIADKGLAGKNEHYRLGVLPAFYAPHFFGEDTSFAVGILVNNQTNLMLRSEAQVEMASVLDAGPAFGVAHRFFDSHLNVGVNLRAIYRLSVDRTLNVTDFTQEGKKLNFKTLGTQGAGFDGDIGALYKLPFAIPFFKGVSVGATLANFMQSHYSNFASDVVNGVKGQPVRNDRTFNGGLRLDFPDMLMFQNTLFAFEMQDVGSTYRLISMAKRLHAGAETNLFGFMAVRAGLNQGYLTGGLGFDLPLVNINLATYGEELGSNAGQLEDRRFLLNLEFAI